VDTVSHPLPAGARREAMLAAIRANEFLRVIELGERFGVSEVTVRADLDALAALGEVRRVHGGAMLISNPRAERSFEDQRTSHAEEKAAIARAAAALVSNGDVVALDVGTTTTALATALGARQDLTAATVVTNGLNIALELERAVYYLQETLPHAGTDVRALVVGERVVASIERVGEGWRTNLARGGRARALRLDGERERLCVRAAAALGADYAGVDLLRTTEGTDYVLEVNGIPGWQGVERTTGVDVAAALAQHLETVVG